MNTLTPTQEKIHEAAMRHFLKDGFRKASLRKIVAEAGFTLGAFYGYYESKEALFDALVGETAQGIVVLISKMGDEADALPADVGADRMTAVFARGLPGLLDYLLAHRDETRLLLKCSEGTRYEGFLDGLMRRDLAFTERMAGGDLPMHPLAARLLVSSYFALLGDAALSGWPREDIMAAMQDIQDVFAGGIVYLMKRRTLL